MPILNIKPHPFKKQRFQAIVPAGCSVAELLPEDHTHFKAFVNGRSYDDQAPLGENDIVDIAITPQGGGSREANVGKAITAGAMILTGGLAGGLQLATVMGNPAFWWSSSGAWAGAAAGAVAAGLQLIGGAPAPYPSLKNIPTSKPK